MDFKVNMAIEGSGAVILSVEGELDSASAERLIMPTETAIGAACPLILDLSQCALIDSSGLRLVLHAHHALSDVGARLAIVTDQLRVRRLLSVAGIDQRVPIFQTLDEGIAWIGSEAERMSDPVRASVRRMENDAPSPTPGPRDPLGGLSFRRLTASNDGGWGRLAAHALDRRVGGLRWTVARRPGKRRATPGTARSEGRKGRFSGLGQCPRITGPYWRPTIRRM